MQIEEINITTERIHFIEFYHLHHLFSLTNLHTLFLDGKITTPEIEVGRMNKRICEWKSFVWRVRFSGSAATANNKLLDNIFRFHVAQVQGGGGIHWQHFEYG